MEANPWFASLPREALLASVEWVHPRRGAMLFCQGAPVAFSHAGSGSL